MQTVDTSFLKGCCAINLATRSWGNRRQGNIDKVQTDADKSRLKLTKSLIVAEEYDAIVRYQRETRDWVLKRTMPLPGFPGGLYLAKVEFVRMIDSELPKRVERMNNLVADLCAVYTRKVNEAREKLNGQFRETDYPQLEELPALFAITHNWVAFDVPDNLPADIIEQERSKLEAKFKDAGEEILYALREGFQKLVSHAVERLTVAPGEKEKVFRDTLIGNIQEFIETFSARNLMNDADLEQLVGRAKGIITGVSPQGLRDSDSLREKTKNAFAEVKSQLDKMVMDKPTRKFEFD